jgi:uncharacterized membrane protein YgcG
MRKLLIIGAILGMVLGLQAAGSSASASTLGDCLAQQHVCVSGSGRALLSPSQESQLERDIGQDQIYLVVAPSGASSYPAAMRQIISTLGGHQQFTVGYLDSQQRHFGAYSKEMLPPRTAANIATQVVDQHRGNVFAGLTAFVQDVQQQAGSGAGGGAQGAPASGSSHVLPTVLIVLGVIVLLAVLGGVLIWRPIRRRRRQELKEAKTAAQDDLIALSAGVTDHEADLSIQSHPDAAAEQAAALTAYEKGTAAMDSARRVRDMGRVSRAIAEGQYHLASARALAAGEAKPARRPACFFDPRHGMSVRDVLWAPSDGGPAREVPACYDCARQLEQGIEPELRRVEVQGQQVPYVNAGFAPAYWGGYGFLPGMFTGFLLGEALAPGPFGGYYGDPGGYADAGSDQGNGDYGGGDFGGGDFGGGWGGGDFGGGDFLYQSQLAATGHRVFAVRDAELAVDGLGVRLHRVQ